MKKWDLNEVILLVDCYNRIAEKGSESATSASLESYFDEEAEKLSKILREREREEKGTIDDRFRNVPGIKMKLHNIEFLATDGKSGLANFSAMDKKGYILYKTNPGQFYQLLSALKVDCRAEDVDTDSSFVPALSIVAEPYTDDITGKMNDTSGRDNGDNSVIAEASVASYISNTTTAASEDTPYYERYNLSPEIFSEISLEEALLSVRVCNCLHRIGIFNIEALLKKSTGQLIGVKNLGRKCIDEIENYIFSLSLCDERNIQWQYHKSKLPFRQYKDSICLGDFSFADTLDLSVNDIEQLDRYKEAFSCLGPELAFECGTNPEYIAVISRAFIDFREKLEKTSQRKTILAELLGALPEGRAELEASYFIQAFTRAPEKRDVLFSLCPAQGCSLNDLVGVGSAADDAAFVLLKKFISWCAFDINNDLEKLYEKLFYKTRNKSILEMRAANKTLEATGNKHNLTRERIRQLEIKAKRIFNAWHSRSRIIYKIAALVQGNSALTPVELEEYFGENTNIILYLLKNINDSGFCYDEQTDAFYVGDEKFSARLQNALDELPNIITKSKLKGIVCDVSESCDIPESVIEKAITDSYRLTGDTYHRSSLTLRAVYESILEKYYPDGILVYNDSELTKFRELVKKEYGELNLPENNRAISARLAALCVLCGRGKYKLRKNQSMPLDLAAKIRRYINGSPYSVIMTNTIFTLFEDELCACGIDNKYYLQGELKELYGHEFIFRRDYVSKDSSVTNLYMEIVKFIKQSKYPVSKAEMFNEFPGVSEIVINIALNDPDVINYFGSYLHSSNLKISAQEKHYLSNMVKTVLADGATHHGKDFYELVEREQPELLQRLGLYTAFSLFSVLEYLFRDHFEFNRPYIAPQGATIDKAGDRLREMVLESDEIAIADISGFAKENRYTIYSLLDYVTSFSETHLMQNYETLTTISLLGVDKQIAKSVEKLILQEITAPTPITQLQCIYKFPKISVPWNEWLIYSVLKKWSVALETGSSSPQYRYAVPIVGPRGTITKEALDSFSELQQVTILEPDNLDDIDDLIADIILDE